MAEINSSATITLKLNVQSAQLSQLKTQLTALATALREGGASTMFKQQQEQITGLQNAIKRLKTQYDQLAASRAKDAQTARAASAATAQKIKLTKDEISAGGKLITVNGQLRKVFQGMGENGKSGFISQQRAMDNYRASQKKLMEDQVKEEALLKQYGQSQQQSAQHARDQATAVKELDVQKKQDAAASAAQKKANDQVFAKNAQNTIARITQLMKEYTAAEKQNAAEASVLAQKEDILKQLRATGLRGTNANKTARAEESAQLKKLYQDVSKVSSADQNATAKLRAFAMESQRLTTTLGQQDKQLQSLRGRLSAFEQQYDAIFRASYRFRAVGQQLIGWGEGLANQFNGLLGNFADYEFELNRAAAATQTFSKGSTVSMAQLSDAVLGVRREVALIPAEDVAKALYYWGSTTGNVITNTEQLTATMAEMTPVLKAAVMTETDYQTAIKGTYSIIAQYYNGALSASQHVTEMLFAATQKTAAEFNDLIQSFKMVGPIARANNVTFDQMNDILGRLADLGVRGSMAGRALRQVFLQLVAPSAKAREAITGLFAEVSSGIADMHGKDYFSLVFPKGQFVGLTTYIHYLAEALSKAGETARNSFLKGIGTANEAPVLIALITQEMRRMAGAADTLDKHLGNAAEASDLFNKTWDQHTQSWKFRMGQLAGTIETLQMIVAGTITKALDPFIDKVVSVIEKITVWVEKNPQIIVSLSKIGAALAGLAIGAGVIATIAGSFMGLAAVIGVTAGAFSAFIIPATATIATVVALGKAIIDNADYIGQRMAEVSQILSKVFGDGAQSVKNFQSVFDAFIQPLAGTLGIVIRTLSDFAVVVAKIIEGFSHLDPNIAKFIGTLAGFLTTIYAINKGIELFGGALSSLGRLFGGLFDNMMRSIPVVNGMWSRLTVSTDVYTGAVNEAQIANRLFNESVEEQNIDLVINARAKALAAANAKVAGMAAQGAVSRLAGFAQSIGGVITKALGIVGVVASIGIALYETVPAVHDFVDSFLDGFKSVDQKVSDTGQHIKDTIDNLGNYGEQLGTSMRAGLDASLQSSSDQQQAAVAPLIAGGESYVVRNGPPKLYYVNSNGDRLGPFYDLNVLQKAITDDYAQLADFINGAISRAVETSAARFGERGISADRLLQDTMNATRATGAFTNPAARKLMATIVTSVMGDIDPASSKAEIVKAVQDKLNRLPGIGRYVSDALADKLGGLLTDTQAQVDRSVSDKIAGYEASSGPLSALQSTLDSLLNNNLLTSSQRTEQALTAWGTALASGLDVGQISKDTYNGINAKLVQLGVDFTSDGDVLATNFADEIQSRVSQFVTRITDALAYQNAKTASEFYDNLSPQFDQIAAEMFDGSASALHDAFVNIQSIITQNPDVTKIPPALSGAMGNALTYIAEQGIDISDQAKTVAATLSGTATAAAEDLGNTAAQSASEIADSIIAGWKSGLDFKKKIRDALKTNDLQNLGKLLTQFLDPAIRRGLNAKNNIGANLYAQAWVQQNIGGIATLLKNAGPQEAAKIGKTLTNFFNDISKRVPHSEIQVIADSILGSFTGLTLPPGLISALKKLGVDITGFVVEGATTDPAEQAAFDKQAQAMYGMYKHAILNAGKGKPLPFDRWLTLHKNDVYDKAHPEVLQTARVMYAMYSHAIANAGHGKPLPFNKWFQVNRKAVVNNAAARKLAQAQYAEYIKQFNLAQRNAPPGGVHPKQLTFDQFFKMPKGKRAKFTPKIDTSKVDTAVTKINGELSGVNTAVNTLQTNVNTVLTNIATTATTTGDSVSANFASGITTGAGLVSAAVKGIVDSITTALSGLGGSGSAGGNGPEAAAAQTSSGAYSWGQHIGSQLAAGITSESGAITKASTDLAQIIKDILGHTSPKRGPLAGDKMTESGKHMMENTARGIGQGSSSVKAAVLKTGRWINVWVKEHYDAAGHHIAGYWKKVWQEITTNHKKHEDQQKKHHRHVQHESGRLHDAIISYLKSHHAVALKWLLSHHQSVLAYMKSHHPEALKSLEGALKKSTDSIGKTAKKSNDKLKGLLDARKAWLKHLHQIQKEIQQLESKGDRGARLRYLKQMEADYKKSIGNISDNISRLHRHHRGHGHAGNGNGGGGGNGGNGGGGGHHGGGGNAHIMTVDRIEANRLIIDHGGPAGPRKITLKVDITSSDGTANKKTQKEIRDAAIKSFALSDLEHYLTVG